MLMGYGGLARPGVAGSILAASAAVVAGLTRVERGPAHRRLWVGWVALADRIPPAYSTPGS
jgi:hypothetical protein